MPTPPDQPLDRIREVSCTLRLAVATEIARGRPPPDYGGPHSTPKGTKTLIL
ncbi:hypothetical protein SAMN04487980_1003176 [Streptomyces sp. cf124]|nr:hypothetical protein SAMN04487980_1003176 [Streptomyces sp. cf124]